MNKDNAVKIEKCANGFIVCEAYRPNVDNVVLFPNMYVFNNFYDMVNYLETHFKLKPDEAKNE